MASSPDTMEGHSTRRSVLRAAGGGAVALTASTAGCLGLLGGGDGGDTLSRWLPAPTVLGVEGYAFHRTDYAALTADDAPFSERATERAEATIGGSDGVFDRDAVEGVVYVDAAAIGALRATVALGSFDPAAVGERLTGEFGAEADGTHRDHDLYVSAGEGSGAAVGAGTDSVVVAVAPEGTRSSVETLLDARAGAVDRYGAADDDVGTLLDGLDGSLYAGGGPGSRGTAILGSFPRSDAVVAGGLDADLDGDEVTFERLYVFEDAETAESVDLTDWRDGLVRLSRVSSLDLGRDGRTVTVSGSVPATAVGVGGSVSLSVIRTTVPQIAFNFEYRAADGVVVITHEGGDTINAENTSRLAVEVDGERAAVWFDGDPGSERVSAGRQVRVDAGPGATVDVVWVPPESSTGVAIGTYTVPE